MISPFSDIHVVRDDDQDTTDSLGRENCVVIRLSEDFTRRVETQNGSIYRLVCLLMDYFSDPGLFFLFSMNIGDKTFHSSDSLADIKKIQNKLNRELYPSAVDSDTEEEEEEDDNILDDVSSENEDSPESEDDNILDILSEVSDEKEEIEEIDEMEEIEEIEEESEEEILLTEEKSKIMRKEKESSSKEKEKKEKKKSGNNKKRKIRPKDFVTKNPPKKKKKRTKRNQEDSSDDDDLWIKKPNTSHVASPQKLERKTEVVHSSIDFHQKKQEQPISTNPTLQNFDMKKPQVSYPPKARKYPTSNIVPPPENKPASFYPNPIPSPPSSNANISNIKRFSEPSNFNPPTFINEPPTTPPSWKTSAPPPPRSGGPPLPPPRAPPAFVRDSMKQNKYPQSHYPPNQPLSEPSHHDDRNNFHQDSYSSISPPSYPNPPNWNSYPSMYDRDNSYPPQRPPPTPPPHLRNRGFNSPRRPFDEPPSYNDNRPYNDIGYENRMYNEPHYDREDSHMMYDDSQYRRDEDYPRFGGHEPYADSYRGPHFNESYRPSRGGWVGPRNMESNHPPSRYNQPKQSPKFPTRGRGKQRKKPVFYRPPRDAPGGLEFNSLKGNTSPPKIASTNGDSESTLNPNSQPPMYHSTQPKSQSEIQLSPSTEFIPSPSEPDFSPQSPKSKDKPKNQKRKTCKKFCSKVVIKVVNIYNKEQKLDKVCIYIRKI